MVRIIILQFNEWDVYHKVVEEWIKDHPNEEMIGNHKYDVLYWFLRYSKTFKEFKEKLQEEKKK